MHRASITETKNRLSALLERVRQGETIVIEDRGVAIAVLAPINGHPADTDEDRIARLERKGLIRRGSGPGPGVQRILSEPPPDITGSLVEAVLEERRAGR